MFDSHGFRVSELIEGLVKLTTKTDRRKENVRRTMARPATNRRAASERQAFRDSGIEKVVR